MTAIFIYAALDIAKKIKIPVFYSIDGILLGTLFARGVAIMLESFWHLFLKTGNIGAYLAYKQALGDDDDSEDEGKDT